MPRPTLLLVRAYALLTLLALGTIGSAVSGAESTTDSAAVRAAAKEYAAAVRRGDAESLRKLWTSDGDYVDASGKMFKAPELIRTQTAAAADNAEVDDVAVQESSLRFVGPDVAIEDGVTDVDAAPDGSGLVGRFTAVWVKRDGRWFLDSRREAVTAPASSSEQLQSLNWLVGEWTGMTENAVVFVTSRWSDEGNYIVREFAVRSEGGEETGGTQRIGWDPAKGQVKCWTFDSQGGSGEGYWHRAGKSWVVASDEVLADGSQSSTSAVYTPLGDGRFVWEVKSAKVDGESLPPQRIEFVRAAND